jgi:hypothetical protein
MAKTHNWGVSGVRYRPVLYGSRVIGYLWAAPGTAGFWPRTGGGAGVRTRAYWMRWLAVARAHGLTPEQALASWNPAYVFPHGTPAIGHPTPLPNLAALRALAAGAPPAGAYAAGDTGVVRHYPVVRGDRTIGWLWASPDDRAAGFAPAPHLPASDPAPAGWRARLATCHATGLTPLQALDALRHAPYAAAIGALTEPLGQAPLAALRD